MQLQGSVPLPLRLILTVWSLVAQGFIDDVTTVIAGKLTILTDDSTAPITRDGHQTEGQQQLDRQGCHRLPPSWPSASSRSRARAAAKSAVGSPGDFSTPALANT